MDWGGQIGRFRIEFLRTSNSLVMVTLNNPLFWQFNPGKSMHMIGKFILIILYIPFKVLLFSVDVFQISKGTFTETMLILVRIF